MELSLEGAVTLDRVVVDGVTALTPDDVAAVACEQATVTLGDGLAQHLSGSRELLETFLLEQRVVYGVTTGYGPLATEYVNAEQSAELQRNLVYHLASGVGPPLSPEHTRALMLARLVSLARGYSGVRWQSLRLLADWLNCGIVPLIPALGTVGASGDLTPLAHMTLALMGTGQVRFRGSECAAAEALAACGLPALSLEGKEGLALVNGTSVMTGIAAVTAVLGGRARQAALALGVLAAEILEAHSDAWHPSLGTVRPHSGQVTVMRELGVAVAGSSRLERGGARPAVLNRAALGDDGIAHGQRLLQNPYTLRCLPQILGAVDDVLRFHGDLVGTELNSVTDNPVLLADEGLAIHGGNFMGQHVSFASDALANALVVMAVHAERIVARITDPSMNGGLPAMLTADRTGLHSGFMGAQVTATALVAEMRTLAVPASVQSIPTNNNNQDVVSMGTIAARKAADLCELLYGVLAIEALVLSQALDLLVRRGAAERSSFCGSSTALAAAIRRVSPFLDVDRPLSSDIEAVALVLRSGAVGVPAAAASPQL